MFTQPLTIDSVESLLPKGYTSRGGTLNDVESAVAMFNAYWRSLFGKDEIANPDDYRSEWQAPSFDLSKDVRLVFAPDGQLIGCGEFWDLSELHVRYHTWGRVHPDHMDRGIGTYLLHWFKARAQESMPRAAQDARISLDNGAADKDERVKPLFEKYGWNLVRKSYRMEIELAQPPAEPHWPIGITLKSFVPDEDLEAVVETDRAAFRDHWGHIELPFEDDLKLFRRFMDKPDFDPTLWLLAMDGDRVAGICLNDAHPSDDLDSGWINVLGVRREYRRRGIGLALLQHSFADFYRRGKRRAGLGVDADSLTGAQHLYEHAGMRVTYIQNKYEKELRSGIDLRTQSIG